MNRTWLLSLVFAFLSPSLSAQPFLLYGVIGDTLVTVDTQTGDASTVGYVGPGFNRIGDLIYHPPTDQLLGVSNPTVDPVLVSIDRVTGLGTSIGFIDLVNPSLDVHLLEGMAYDDVSGQVYVAVHEDGPTSNWYYSRRFGTLDIATGNAIQTASVSGTCQDDFDGMDIGNGNFYAVDGCPSPVNFYTANSTTATATFVGSTNTVGIADLAIEPTTNVIFAPVNQARQLVTINPATGAATVIGNTHSAAEYNGDVMISLAFAPDPIVPIQLNVTVVDVSCFGDADGSIDAVASGSNPPMSYSLNGGPFLPSGSFTGLAAGSYTVTAQDALGNDSTVVLVINSPLSLQVSANVTIADCANENDGSVMLANTGGTPGFSFSIDGINFGSSVTFDNLAPGQYTGWVQDQNGCLASIPFTIGDPPALQLSFVPTAASCQGIDDGSVLFVPGGGSPGYMYSLDGLSFSNQDLFTGLAAGSYTGTVQDQNGCLFSMPFVITAPNSVLLTLDNVQQAICPDQPSAVSASASGGNPPYTFSLGAGPNQNNGQFTGLVAGSYSLTGTDQQGCQDDLQFQIAVVPPLDPSFAASSFTCTYPAEIDFTPNQNNWSSLNWDFGDGNGSIDPTPFHFFNSSGAYQVQLTVENVDGCQDSSIIQVNLPELPIANFSSEPEIPGLAVLGDPIAFQNLSEHSSLWHWDFGDGGISFEEHPQIEYSSLGEFCVRLIALNELGCADTVLRCGFEVVGDGLFIPSAFSPNGDDLNEQFEIVAGYNPAQFHLLIFNRWGQLIFESHSLADFWDAKFKGMPVPEGVFVWRMEYADPHNNLRHRQGTVTVVR